MKRSKVLTLDLNALNWRLKRPKPIETTLIFGVTQSPLNFGPRTMPTLNSSPALEVATHGVEVPGMLTAGNPVPVPTLANLDGLKPEHLNNLAPIDDLPSLALQVALLTGTVADLIKRLETIENDRYRDRDNGPG